MKSILTFLLFTASVLSSVDKPNILIIYADDLGYGDLQCYNPQGKIATPAFDQLAKEGIRFTDGHSSSAVCSPSRYTLLTGRYHWRSKLQKGIVGLWKEPLITSDRMTLASLASANGYDTAMIGKWHLGWNWPIPAGKHKYFSASKNKPPKLTEEHVKVWKETFSKPIKGGPTAVGFDYYFGTDVPNWPPYCFIENDRTVGIPAEFAAQKLMKKNQASKQGPALKGWALEPILPALGSKVEDYLSKRREGSKPFFIYMPLTTPHTPLSVNKEWLGKSNLNLYADLVMETDAVVGGVLKKLKETGLDKNTLVIFTSDNGCAHYIGSNELEEKGHFPSGSLRGYKSDVWEGGHRVPFIVKWPGHIKAGTVSDRLVHQADIMRTVAEILGVELPANAGEDSFSLLPVFEDSKAKVRDTSVSCSISGVPSIRLNNWKLIFGKGSGGWTKGGDKHPVQLYDLGEDLGEKNNLAPGNPEKIEMLKKLMGEVIDRGRSTEGPKQNNDVKVIRYP